MFPFAGMPTAIQWLAEVLPLTHFLRIIRGVMLRGGGLFELWPDVLALVVFTAVMMTLAIAQVPQAAGLAAARSEAAGLHHPGDPAAQRMRQRRGDCNVDELADQLFRPAKFTDAVVLGACRRARSDPCATGLPPASLHVPTIAALIARDVASIVACRRCRRASLTSRGVSSGSSAAGVPGRGL